VFCVGKWRSFDGVLSGFGLHGGVQFGFKDGGQVIVPVFLEFTEFY
jgi:hypothetical protein